METVHRVVQITCARDRGMEPALLYLATGCSYTVNSASELDVAVLISEAYHGGVSEV